MDKTKAIIIYVKQEFSGIKKKINEIMKIAKEFFGFLFLVGFFFFNVCEGFKNLIFEFYITDINQIPLCKKEPKSCYFEYICIKYLLMTQFYSILFLIYMNYFFAKRLNLITHHDINIPPPIGNKKSIIILMINFVILYRTYLLHTYPIIVVLGLILIGMIYMNIKKNVKEMLNEIYKNIPEDPIELSIYLKNESMKKYVKKELIILKEEIIGVMIYIFEGLKIIIGILLFLFTCSFGFRGLLCEIIINEKDLPLCGKTPCEFESLCFKYKPMTQFYSILCLLFLIHKFWKKHEEKELVSIKKCICVMIINVFILYITFLLVLYPLIIVLSFLLFVVSCINISKSKDKIIKEIDNIHEEIVMV